MAELIPIEHPELHHSDKEKFCKELENGNILFFSKCPFDFPKKDIEFLLAQKQTNAAHRKNIAYKPQSDKITNFVKSSDKQQEQLLGVMRGFSHRVTTFLTQLLPPYAGKWRLDYASFRPFQEKGRELRTHARNDLLHVDSFPTRPMHGNRILRFFININPSESRHWTTTEPFEKLAETFGGSHVPFPPDVTGSLIHQIKRIVHKLGFPIILRSPYDLFMLELHNFLKENQEFQKNCPKNHWEFPPGSCWIVFTDQVSHAATAGQYALEQTLIIPQQALVTPEKSPLRVLEQFAGRSML